MKDQYYKIVAARQDYKGVRYFRFNPTSEKVVQICISHGHEKKGRTNSFGIYLIHRLTFLTNYMMYDYAEPCSKKEYDKQFIRVVKMLE